MSWRFEVPGRPVPWQRVRRGRNGATYVPKKTREYEDRVGWCAKKAGVKRLKGEVCLSLWIYFPDNRRRDADNVQKAVQDGLNGVAWEDDSQVKEWHGVVAVDVVNPRVVVKVEER